MLHPLPGILPFLFRPFWFIQLHFSQSSCLECEIACGLQLHSAFYIFLGEGGEWVLGGGGDFRCQWCFCSSWSHRWCWGQQRQGLIQFQQHGRLWTVTDGKQPWLTRASVATVAGISYCTCFARRQGEDSLCAGPTQPRLARWWPNDCARVRPARALETRSTTRHCPTTDFHDTGVLCLIGVPTDLPSRDGDVVVYVQDINQPSLPTPFYSVLVSISVFMALSTVFHSINSDGSPLSHSVRPVLFLPYCSFQVFISLWKSPLALI